MYDAPGPMAGDMPPTPKDDTMTISREALAVDLWPAIGYADPDSLADAWRQMHDAARALAEIGASPGRPAAGGTLAAFAWSHTDAGWIIEWHGEGTPERRIIGWLDLAAGSAWLEREDPQEGSWIELEGRTAEDVRAWGQACLHRLSAGESGPTPEPIPQPMVQPAGRAGPFCLPDTDARGDLEAIYESAGLLLHTLGEVLEDRFGAAEDGATPRLWPDRFNAESRFVITSGSGDQALREVGVGVSPPDEIDASGYWYVSPHAAAGSDACTCSDRPALPVGRWVGREESPPLAVLPLADIRALGDGDAQMLAVTGFIAAAFNACAGCPETSTPNG